MNQEALPVFAPPSGESSPTTPNQYRSGESRESFQQSASKARQVRAVLTKVITSREELAHYLGQHGLKLLTSAVEFEKTRDFIGSSYIMYAQANDYLEPVSTFIERYPDYRPSFESITTSLRAGQAY